MKGQPERRGRWFDEFAVGQVLRTGARTVTEADVVGFAGISGDYNPLHTDAEFAARTPFRGRIAHGFLVQAIASGLVAQTGVFDGTIAALEAATAQFVGAVRAGDTLSVELRVAHVDEQPARRRGRVRFDIEVFDQHGTTTSRGEWVTLMLRERAAPRADDGADEADHAARQETTP